MSDGNASNDWSTRQKVKKTTTTIKDKKRETKIQKDKISTRRKDKKSGNFEMDTQLDCETVMLQMIGRPGSLSG